MTTITNTTITGGMIENLITYIELHMTDPLAVKRAATASLTNSNAFVKLSEGRSEGFLPQILIELPSGGSASPTGLQNQMVFKPFTIRIHTASQVQAIDLSDELFDYLKRDISSFFQSSLMYRSRNSYLTPSKITKHETDFNEWYATMQVTFEYFHYGA